MPDRDSIARIASHPLVDDVDYPAAYWRSLFYFNVYRIAVAALLLLTTAMLDENILFASEMVGAVRGIDPRTGHHYDDTRRYLDAAVLADEARAAIMCENARRVFPRLV